MVRVLLVYVLLGAVFSLVTHAAEASNNFNVNLDVLVKTGDLSPDGNGVFSNTLISAPMLNNQGEVLIWSTLVATNDPTTIDDFGFYRLSREGNVALVRGGDTSSTGEVVNLNPQALTVNTNRFSQQGIIEDGSIRFVLATGANSAVLYEANDNGLFTLLETGPATGVSTDLQVFPSGIFINDVGLSSFLTITPEFGFSQAVAEDNGPLILIEPGTSLPDGRVAIAMELTRLVGGLNNNGQAALPIRTKSSPINSSGFYLTDGDQISKIIHLGEPAVDGLGSYAAQLGNCNISDAGTAIFTQLVDDISADYMGLFFYDGSDNIEEWVRTGDDIGGEGVLTTLNGSLYINDDNVGLFSGRFFGDAGAAVESLFYRSNGVTRRIISSFDQLPEPIGVEVRSPFSYALNASGQVLIFASVIADGVTQQGILLYQPDQGFALVARTGMPFRGDTLAAMDLALPVFTGINNLNNTNAMNAFNDEGEVAFTYALQNGEVGIALASVEFQLEDSLFADGFEGN